MVQITFRNTTYNTQTDFKKYIDKLLYKDISFCEDIKKKFPRKFEIITEFLRRHPNWETKSKDMRTIKTVENKDNKNNQYGKKSSIHMVIICENGEERDISWNKAIKGKEKTIKEKLVDAMRCSIQPQIDEFRRTHKHECSLLRDGECKGKREGIHVDHYKPQFKELVERFIDREFPTPEGFDKKKLNETRESYCFKTKDREFEDKWKKYHKDTAELRILCQDCNLRREKYKS